jgi:acetoin:2,6-dichlorophenolindophenol oxidoreductase subunit alpha
VTAKLPIAQRAEAYGIPWHLIDGNDLLEVYKTMQAAVNHVRSGGGPVLVEAETYRYFGHSKSDRNLYRTKEEIDAWREKDPVARVKCYLVESGALSAEEAKEIDEEAQRKVESAVSFAEASPEPDVATLMEYVYA